MKVAAMKGSSVYYMENESHVMVDKGNDFTNMTPETFEYLYYRLDDEFCALKEDCIEYAIYDKDKDLFSYPYWYIEATYRGDIYHNTSGSYIYDYTGELAMSHKSVILRNFLCELMYMELETFRFYYETEE